MARHLVRVSPNWATKLFTIQSIHYTASFYLSVAHIISRNMFIGDTSPAPYLYPRNMHAPLGLTTSQLHSNSSNLRKGVIVEF